MNTAIELLRAEKERLLQLIDDARRRMVGLDDAIALLASEPATERPLFARPPEPGAAGTSKKQIPILAAVSDVHVGRRGGLAGEIKAKLPDLMKQFPLGPTTQQLAAYFAAEPNTVRAATKQLLGTGDALLRRRADTSCVHLQPVGFVQPRVKLTPTQERALECLMSIADPDGYINCKLQELGPLLKSAEGAASAMRCILLKKNYLEFVSPASRGVPPVYRIVPEIWNARKSKAA